MQWDTDGLTITVAGVAHQIPMSALFVFLFSLCLFSMLLILFARGFRSRRSRPCRWQRIQQQDRAAFHAWYCTRCAAEAFTYTRGRPNECKKALKTGL
jgi:hypothetical protein